MAAIPYRREGVSEDVAKTYLLDPVFFAAEDSFKRRGERGIEIDARRNLSIDGDVKVTEGILFTDGDIDGR